MMRQNRNHDRQQRELIELWLLANEGSASPEQLDALSQRIQAEPEARESIFTVAHHQGWLAWQGGPAPRLESTATSCAPAESSLGAGACPECEGLAGPHSERAASRRDRNAERALRDRWKGRTTGRLHDRSNKVLNYLSAWLSAWPFSGPSSGVEGLARTPLLSLRGLFVIATTIVAVMWGMSTRTAPVASAPEQDLLDARLVGGTLCLWDPSGTARPDFGGRLHEGDSLQLLEGIAELSLEHHSTTAKVVMEGPAAVVLARDAVPNLRYGRISVTTSNPSDDRFPVETSFGRVTLEPGSEIGISAFGSSAQVHVFTGVATVESPWLISAGHETASKVVTPGEALIFEGVGKVALQVKHSTAMRHKFTHQVSMQSDFLAVGPDYVRVIREAGPLAYWRFEADSPRTKELEGLAVNEMGDRFHGRVRGEVRWIGPEGNQAIEFGVTPDPGSIVVEESWDEVLDGDFSLEAWIKPSHYHLGSIIGFIGEFDWKNGRNKHGVLLEVGGTSQPSSIHQPERIRFLHRPILGTVGGVSCFSDERYQPRRWQHVVAVREGKELRLYLDGELVASGEESQPMALGLQLVLGQLYSETVERFFIGHMDEVAVYDRSLSGAEVWRHFEMLRPAAKAGDKPFASLMSGTAPPRPSGAASSPGISSYPEADSARQPARESEIRGVDHYLSFNKKRAIQFRLPSSLIPNQS